MKKVVTTIIILAVVAGLSFVGYRAFAGRESAPSAELETVPVERGDIVATVNASGSIVPRTKVTLSFKMPGRVAEIAVEKGDHVEAGEILARLETTDLELAVAQAEAALAMSEAQLERTRKGARPEDLAVAEAVLAGAQASYRRVAAGPNAEDLVAAEAGLASARANHAKVLAGPSQDEIAVARANLEQAEAVLRQAQAAYDQVAGSPHIWAMPQSLQLESATIAYEQAQAAYNLTVNVTDREVKAAAAQVAQAEAQLARLSRSPTPEELAIAQAQVDQAQATLDKIRAGATPEELAIAQAQVDQAQVAVELARSRLEDTRLVAPFAGTVAHIGAEMGELVSSAIPMIVLVDLSGYHIDIRVDETDIGLIEVGQEVEITLDAFPDAELSGQVVRIDPAGANILGIVSYGVTIEISSADVPLKPDMTANVDIVVESKEGVLLVPNRAVERGREGKYVEILVAGQPRQVYIETGLSNGTFTEVVAGLKEGQRVIIKTQQQRIREEMMEMIGP